MDADTRDAVAESLREWARGSDGLEAVVELVIRAAGGRLAEPGWPWIEQRWRRGADWYMLDVAAITAQAIDALSGPEQQVLQVAASLAGGAPVRLDELGCLDRQTLDLVLAAIAHAGGSHQQRGGVPDPDPGASRVGDRGSVHPWPGR